MEDIINQWFADHFHNSKASQDTEVFNILQAAKLDLIKRLKPAESGKPQSDKEI